MREFRTVACVLVAGALVLAGCGDDGETTGTTGIDGAAASDGVVELEIGDRFFAPEALGAEPGSTITLAVTNRGALDHTFTVDGAGVDEVVPAGDAVQIEVTVPDGDGASFYCRFHTEMQGSLVADDGDETPADVTVPSGGGGGYGY